jgi:ABC-2 type transport system permease protein
VGFAGELAIPAVGLLLGVGLTRRLEESGVIELVTSARVARTAVPVAALASASSVVVLREAACEAGLYVLGFNLHGSTTYPVILALYGIAFTGIGTAGRAAGPGQRGAYAISGVVIIGFLTRAYIDGRQLRLRVGVTDGMGRRGASVGDMDVVAGARVRRAARGTSGAAVLIASRRDLGSGVLAQRPWTSSATRVAGDAGRTCLAPDARQHDRVGRSGRFVCASRSAR